MRHFPSSLLTHYKYSRRDINIEIAQSADTRIVSICRICRPGISILYPLSLVPTQFQFNQVVDSTARENKPRPRGRDCGGPFVATGAAQEDE